MSSSSSQYPILYGTQICARFDVANKLRSICTHRVRNEVQQIAFMRHVSRPLSSVCVFVASPGNQCGRLSASRCNDDDMRAQHRLHANYNFIYSPFGIMHGSSDVCSLWRPMSRAPISIPIYGTFLDAVNDAETTPPVAAVQQNGRCACVHVAPGKLSANENIIEYASGKKLTLHSSRTEPKVCVMNSTGCAFGRSPESTSAAFTIP